MTGDAISYLADGDDERVLEGLEVVRGGSLESVLERIAAGEFSALVVVRLHAIASSLRDLIVLLDWLAAVGARLVAIDVNLDTGSAAGRRTVTALREVARWERDPGPGRAPRGRPGLTAQAPELSGQITALRKAGLSLQAIADTLNAEGVPTPRGGAHWRPSSVQAALGYRRPPPGPRALRGPGETELPPGPGRQGSRPAPPRPHGRHPADGRGARRARKGPKP